MSPKSTTATSQAESAQQTSLHAPPSKWRKVDDGPFGLGLIQTWTRDYPPRCINGTYGKARGSQIYTASGFGRKKPSDDLPFHFGGQSFGGSGPLQNPPPYSDMSDCQDSTTNLRAGRPDEGDDTGKGGSSNEEGRIEEQQGPPSYSAATDNQSKS